MKVNLNLPWVHMSEGMFSEIAVHLLSRLRLSTSVQVVAKTERD